MGPKEPGARWLRKASSGHKSEPQSRQRSGKIPKK